MKTLHISIITGSGITLAITAAIILVCVQSSYADGGLTIAISNTAYGVGEPISFFVEIDKELQQNNIFPTAIIVNEQNQTVWYDNDLPPNGYKDATKIYYVQQHSENVPIISQTGKYKLIVTYGNQKTSEDLTISELISENNMLHFYGTYNGLGDENGIVTIANQAYYLTTIHKIPSDIIRSSDTTITSHDVSFTFPGCGMCPTVPTVSNPSYDILVRFPDQTNQTLAIRDNMWPSVSPPIDDHEYFPNGTKIFPNGTKGTWTMTQYKDPILTTLSTHTDPQAAITVTHDSIKLLVSTKNQTSSVPEFPFVIPVLLIGIISLIVFYNMRFRK